MNEEKMACRGATTEEVRAAGDYGTHMEQCRSCQRAVACHLTDHPFFGFQTCENSVPVEQPPARR